MLLNAPHPHDVVYVASHAGRVMADYARPVAPKGVFANDAGAVLDGSGVEGVRLLDKMALQPLRSRPSPPASATRPAPTATACAPT
jgi:hypothetical protein